LTGTDLGEWDSTHPDYKNILQVHKSHDGFGEGVIEKKVTLENIATDFMNKNFHKMFHVVINSYKTSTQCCLLKERLK
jgi:hypothetical protein